MKFFNVIIVICIALSQGIAQTSDSIKIFFEKKTLVADTINDFLLPVNKNEIQTTDSLMGKMKFSKMNGGLLFIESGLDTSKNGLRDKIRITNDTLSEFNRNSHRKVDHIENLLEAKIDSLRAIKVSNVHVVRSLDSLRAHLDSLQNVRLIATMEKTIAPMTKFQFDVNAGIFKVGNTVNTKLDLFNKNEGNVGNLKLPAINAKLSGLDGTILSGANPGLLTGLPKTTINFSRISIGNSVPELKMPALEGLSKINIKSLDLSTLGSPDLKNLGKEVRDFSKVSGDIGKYQKDIKNISKGNIDSTQLENILQSRIAGRDDLKGLQNQLKDVTSYKEMTEKWNADPEVSKELALNKAKEASVNYFAGHEQELQAALSKMTQLKEKYKGAEGVLDIVKKRQGNAMKGKPFSERFLPGIAIQIQKPSMLWVDFNPYVSYRLTGRFTVATGWNERIVYDMKNNSFFADKRIYGIRSSIHFKVKESLWLKTDIENMNTPIPPQSSIASSQDFNSRKWVWSYFGGIKKDFKFSRKVIGTTQVLYNFYDPRHESPYANKLNVRIGFEYKLHN